MKFKTETWIALVLGIIINTAAFAAFVFTTFETKEGAKELKEDIRELRVDIKELRNDLKSRHFR